MRTVFGWVTAWSLLSGWIPAAGQSALRGRVRADSTLRSIPAAEIIVEGAGGGFGRARLDGGFLLGPLESGRHALVIRAIGFRPLRLTADFGRRDTIEIDVRLTPVAQELAPLVVAAARRPGSVAMEEFNRRRLRGFGRFLTRAQLAARQGLRLTDALRNATGIRFQSLPIACGSGLAVVSMRPRTTPPPPSMDCNGQAIASACYLDLFLDGMPVWQWGQSPPPDIDQYAVHQVQAVEIYAGEAELPTEFPRSAGGCGALVIWLRTSDR